MVEILIETNLDVICATTASDPGMITTGDMITEMIGGMTLIVATKTGESVGMIAEIITSDVNIGIAIGAIIVAVEVVGDSVEDTDLERNNLYSAILFTTAGRTSKLLLSCTNLALKHHLTKIRVLIQT